MDIIEEYISKFDNYIVRFIEKIPLNDNTIDIIICVGSILNYVDSFKAIKEFNRVLTLNGLLLEFEHSNSAGFLFTRNYCVDSFF